MPEYELLEIPVKDIEIGMSQARLRNIENNIDELVESIKKRGLLQPLTVYRKENGKYEVVIGQRRFLAVKKLGWSNIRSILINKDIDLVEAKMDSITENEIREPMHIQDKVDVCTHLYYKYGSVKAVADELGWSTELVGKYIKIERLPGILRDEVKRGSLSLDIALKVIDSLLSNPNDELDVQKAYELALELQRLSPPQRTSSYDIIRSYPYQSVENILEKGKEIKEHNEITLNFFKSDIKRIKRFAEDQKKEVEESLIDLIKEYLRTYGY